MLETTVLVVGAGPVGLVTALGLAERGVDTLIVDENSHRMSGLHDDIYQWSVLPHLQQLGILTEMEQSGVTEHLWTFRVLRTGERITLDMNVLSDLVEHPYNVHLPTVRLAEIVERRLAACAHVELRRGTPALDVVQDDDHVTVRVCGPDGEYDVRARWLIGADGAHSTVRRSIGMGLPGTTWPERFVATNVTYDFNDMGLTRVSYHLDPTNGALIGKLDTGGLWRYVYAESRQLAEESIADRMPAHFRSVLGDGVDPEPAEWRAFRVHDRAAASFVSGRVLLVGDAAHITNPTLSLGLQGGLHDAVSVAAVLDAVISGAASVESLHAWAGVRRRMFYEFASPQSSDMMAMVFHCDDADRLEADLADLRRIEGNPSEQQKYLVELSEHNAQAQLQDPILTT